MSESSLHTTKLQACLKRIRAGDRTAHDDLLLAAARRLVRLAHKLTASFPKVQRWVDTEDVLQGALLRLVRSLEEVEPNSMREFFSLAATHMRRELLDLARHFYGPQGMGANYRSVVNANDGKTQLLDGVASDESPADLDQWCRFHTAVEQLPTVEREIVGLMYYHGYSSGEVADLFDMHERTVRRRFQRILVKLHGLLGEKDVAE